MARRIGNTWFASAVTFDDFGDIPHGWYSIDGAPDVDMGELTVEEYQSEPNPVPGPDYGTTVTLYRGSVNPTIPAEALGPNVVYKIYVPGESFDALEYDPITVCIDVATTVTISPASATVAIGKTRQFTALFTAADDLPTENYDAPEWSVDGGGTISATGLFTAGSEAGGPHTVAVTSGGLSDTAEVTVITKILSQSSYSYGGSYAY
jgi:hypothetical protein